MFGGNQKFTGPSDAWKINVREMIKIYNYDP
jgi:hypothetical protein